MDILSKVIQFNSVIAFGAASNLVGYCLFRSKVSSNPTSSGVHQFSPFELITESTDVNELVENEPWLSSEKLVVKPDMLFGKRGKSGLVAMNLDLAQVAVFVKDRLGKEIKAEIEEFIKAIFTVFLDLDYTFMEMNPFTLVNGKPYPLDMKGELDDTATFKNFKKWGNIEFPLPFGRVMNATESFIHGLDEKTSASLKFTVLNPKGRIWTMVAGGGASISYADT
ncbi:ATP-citrate synthase alpha chain protein 1, partial [Sarracenia purpurea var. burkii]